MTEGKKEEGRKFSLQSIASIIMLMLLLLNSAVIIYIYFSMTELNRGLIALDNKTTLIGDELNSFENKTIKAFEIEEANTKTLNEKIDYESEYRREQVLNLYKNINQLSDNLLNLYSYVENISEESSEMFKSIYGRVDVLENMSREVDIEKLQNSIVAVETHEAYGSGVIIGSEGYILTNYHVVEGYFKKDVDVKLYSGEEYTARVFSRDSKKDLALLKINEEGLNLSTMEFEEEENINVGDTVYALGNPYGLDFTVTQGIISAFRRTIDRVDYVQTDVPINPGNSGGPLVNEQGKIVGINTLKRVDSEGLGFAIHVSELTEFVEGKIG